MWETEKHLLIKHLTNFHKKIGAWHQSLLSKISLLSE